jgi:hypothetical protein
MQSTNSLFLIAAAMVSMAQTAIAADTTIVVWPGDANGWSYTNFETDAWQAFVNGPETPPLGAGSSSFAHNGPPGYNGGTLHTDNLNGMYLRDIVSLAYWSYQQGADGLAYQPPYVQIFLDLDDDGFVDDGIGFEPAWQTSGRYMVGGLQETPFSTSLNENIEQNGLGATGGGTAANQWWEWDLLIGSWWSRGGALATGTYSVGQYQCYADGCVTIEGIVEIYPNARIISQASLTGTGGLRLQYGFGGNSHEYVGHVDKLVIGVASGDVTIYDFELGPDGKEACKKDGWEGFFKNQGQCVSYFESNRVK